MRSIIPLLLILLLAWSSTSAQLGYSIVGPLSKAAFDCLGTSSRQATGHDPFVFFRIYKVSGTPGVDPNAAQALANARASSVAFGILSYIEVCRSADSSVVRNTLVQAFNPPIFDSIWIKVEPNSTPGCSWEGFSQTDNCAYITEFYQALFNAFSVEGVSIGIFSTASIWKKFFGSSCNLFGEYGVSLWYAHYGSNGKIDSTQSFDDFVPFGGFMPYFKQIGGSVHISLCNNPNWKVIVDTLYTSY